MFRGGFEPMVKLPSSHQPIPKAPIWVCLLGNPNKKPFEGFPFSCWFSVRNFLRLFLGMNLGIPLKETTGWRVLLGRGGLFATLGGKMIDPLVVKDSFLRGSPIFSQKVATRPPCC